MQVQTIDSLDKQILNEIQWQFPLVNRPFLEISKRYNISEDEVLERIRTLKRTGLIRQINAIFDTRRLGYKSTLVAFSVLQDKLEQVANVVNSHPGVSHNYERNHEYNMWFTLAVPPSGDLKRDLEHMASQGGVIKYRVLPTLKLYKIGVKLDVLNQDPSNPQPTEELKTVSQAKFTATDLDKRFIRVLQQDIETTSEPFKNSARALGITTDQLFEKAKEYEKIGVMRRFAAILRHRDAGFSANGMVVWKVPDDKIDEVGYKLAAFPQVSHCYRRPVFSDWPFNLFSMVHARTLQAAERIAETMSSAVKIQEYSILFSSREFKKQRVKYFE
ncbi:MAG TPA: AsnC family transcriptional regulator [Nitrososphaeraceae archaeon]|nr:AsnC family transcriptional regulator [Nitrososphaeraceae archaeon]